MRLVGFKFYFTLLKKCVNAFEQINIIIYY